MDKEFKPDIHTIPKELQLILNLLKTQSGSNITEIKGELKNIDWKHFLELVFHHRIYPILYEKVKMFGEDLIPVYVIHTLGKAFKKNTFEMLYLCAEMEYLASIFNERQIRMMVLKGPVLAQDLYGDLSLRTSKDLDILISIRELEKADQILQQDGYIKKEFINLSLNDWKWRNHHFEYFHPEKRISIEIHWRLNPFPGGGPDFVELWQRKRKSSLTNYPIYYLGREDLFLFLASHGSRHGWFRLRWLVDINQMINQEINWKILINQLKRYQYIPAGGQALALASGLLDAQIPSELMKLVKRKKSKKLAQAAIFYLEKMVDLHTEPVPKDIDDYHKKHLNSLLTKRKRFLYVLSYLYPYPLDAETLPLPKKLHILYFPLRPFLWVWRKTKKHALP